MVSRAPILHTYALTSLNYWKWDHPQLSYVPLPCWEGRMYGGIAPAPKAGSSRPCPSLSCCLPGGQTLSGLILEGFGGQLGMMQHGHIDVAQARGWGVGSACTYGGVAQAMLWFRFAWCCPIPILLWLVSLLQFPRLKANFSLKHWFDSAHLGYV